MTMDTAPDSGIGHSSEEIAAAVSLPELTRERDELLAAQQDAWNSRHMRRIVHHQPWRLAGESGRVTEVSEFSDKVLEARVAAAYRQAVKTPVGSTNSIWLNEFASLNESTHQTLTGDDSAAIATLLRNPSGSMLFYGFDSLQARDASSSSQEWWIHWNHRLAYDGLLQLARAAGIRRVENPETGLDFDEAPDTEELLVQLDHKFGFRIDFPNLFVGEVGLKTSRGIANSRAVYALYQAWRASVLVKDSSNPKIIEIGAGLGRSVYYAAKFGLVNYTVIDIPLTGVSQGYYLGRLLGGSNVSLWGENQTSKVRILPPAAFKNLNERFDLLINVDSMTEMARPTAEQYLQGAKRLTHQFLSINHEHNAFTVESIYAGMNVSAQRSPCWIRRGYVEEVIQFGPRPRPRSRRFIDRLLGR